MARCWTCHRKVAGFRFTCPECESCTELRHLHQTVTASQEGISEKIEDLEQSVQRGFHELSNSISSGFAVLASAMEWGFQEITWQIAQQTKVLRALDERLKSIDHAVNYQGIVRAGELREQAEELRRREVLDESEEFYKKALECDRLDYRIYVGLAETYLRSGQFDEALAILNRSLPHAPKKDVDYRSYSLRLIGHIQACGEDFTTALETLRQAIELSPGYADAHYDYAQYCAQSGSERLCVESLEKAIIAKPLFWCLAKHERDFDPTRLQVSEVLSKIQAETFQPTDEIMQELLDVYKITRQLIPESNLTRALPALQNEMQAVELLYGLRNVSRFYELRRNLLSLLSGLHRAVAQHLKAMQAGLGTKYAAEVEEANEQYSKDSKLAIGVCAGLYLVAIGSLIWLEFQIESVFFSPDSAFLVGKVAITIQVLVTAVALFFPFAWVLEKWLESIQDQPRRAKDRLNSFQKKQVMPLANLLQRLKSLLAQCSPEQKSTIVASRG